MKNPVGTVILAGIVVLIVDMILKENNMPNRKAKERKMERRQKHAEIKKAKRVKKLAKKQQEQEKK